MDTLEQAITAFQSGDKQTAQDLLVLFLKTNPEHETAWLWLAATTDNIARKRGCYELVLAINPNNEQAKQGLVTLATLNHPSTVEIVIDAPEQKCPSCAQTIHAKAKICPFCGTDLRARQKTGQVQQPAMVQRPASKKNSRVILLAAIGLIILVVCACSLLIPYATGL